MCGRALVVKTKAEAAGAPDEIEVTPAMIEAGLEWLYGYDRNADIAEETVEEIFKSMVLAARMDRGFSI
jgi:hypothetical protein